MWRNGTRSGRQEWACQVQRRALNAQRFRISIGGYSYYHGHVKDPAALMRLQMLVLEHRAKQAEEYRAFSDALEAGEETGTVSTADPNELLSKFYLGTFLTPQGLREGRVEMSKFF